LGWRWQLLLLVCRHYEEEAKDKRICAAHQATVFYFVYLVVFAFGLFTSWRKINCATGATMSTTDSKKNK